MNRIQAIQFLRNYTAGAHTQLERLAFLEWLKEADENDVERLMLDYEKICTEVTFDSSPDAQLLRALELRLDQEDAQQLQQNRKAIIRQMPQRNRSWWFAAGVIILLAAAAYYWAYQVAEPNQLVVSTIKQMPDVEPGENRATLTLADGSVIALENAADGMLATQGNAEINKIANGEIVYQGVGDPAKQLLYNLVSTPTGGQFKIVLPDGSRVWLNAASTLRYPTAFVNGRRTVELTGEGYFEIAKDAGSPFIVQTGGEEVKVLGTHFNVNAYANEPGDKITLLEGSVQVGKDDRLVVLKPGQQVRLEKSGVMRPLETVDTSAVVAWKNGQFNFSNDDIAVVLRQISRWYSMEIVYEGAIPVGHLTGIVPRNMRLSNVLKLLEASGVYSRLDGKTLTILKE